MARVVSSLAAAASVVLLTPKCLVTSQEDSFCDDADSTCHAPPDATVSLLQKQQSPQKKVLQRTAEDAALLENEEAKRFVPIVVHHRSSSPMEFQEPRPPKRGCYIVKRSDHRSKCVKAINWAMTRDRKGIVKKNPEMKAAKFTDWQAFIARNKRGVCPIPCGGNVPGASLCEEGSLPSLWEPNVDVESDGSGKLEVKILSYNLFWWNLFSMRKGNHNSAGKLIRSFSMPAFDVMGFQECEDIDRVLTPVGLADHYGMLMDEKRAICAAFRKDKWTLVAHGVKDVASDQFTEFYGSRGTIWMRLRHRNSSTGLFFLNHHGPLAVNSGGNCGGVTTARNILNVAKEHSEQGDLIVIVGDFNANALSTTVQTLWKNLVFAYNGASFGGVDNVFTNAPKSALYDTRDLGKGGSDHSAISVTFRFGNFSTDNLSEDISTRNNTADKPDTKDSCEHVGCHGEYEPERTCQCTDGCHKYHNCCSDYSEKCHGEPQLPHDPLCKNYGCGVPYSPRHKCQCSSDCIEHSSCCTDYLAKCTKPSVADEPATSIARAEQSECGLQHTDTMFTYPENVQDDVWTAGDNLTTTTRMCCNMCKDRPDCKSWVWKDWIVERRLQECYFYNSLPTGSRAKEGFMSGYTPQVSMIEAKKHMHEAISRMPSS